MSEKLTGLSEAATVSLSDILYVVLNPGSNPVSRKIALSALLSGKIGSAMLTADAISGFDEEATPAAGDMLLALVEGSLKKVDIGNMAGIDWGDEVDTDVLPDQDAVHDLGSADKEFAVVFAAALALAGTTVDAILNESDMASNSSTALSVQSAIKAYVDNRVDFMTVVPETVGFTVGGNHLNALVNCSHATGFTAELASDANLSPNNTVGFSTLIRQTGDGPITIGDDSGASTILYDDTHFQLQTANKQSAVLAVYVATDTWWVHGDLKPLDEVTVIPIQVLDADTDCAVGDGAGNIRFFVPNTLNGEDIVGVKAYVATAGTTGSMTVQLHNVTQAADILSTKLTVASTAKVDDGNAVIDTSEDDLATNDEIRVDIDAVHTTEAKGLWIELQTKTPAS